MKVLLVVLAITVLPDPTVGDYEFSVQHGSEFDSLTAFRKIPFDIIKHNHGVVYDVTNNVFKAPASGVYSFEFSAASKVGFLTVFLHSSNQSRLVSAVAATANSHAYNSIIVDLNAGELISVELGPYSKSRRCTPACTTFSGRLLRKAT